jgi:hypothetical protein
MNCSSFLFLSGLDRRSPLLAEYSESPFGLVLPGNVKGVDPEKTRSQDTIQLPVKTLHSRPCPALAGFSIPSPTAIRAKPPFYRQRDFKSKRAQATNGTVREMAFSSDFIILMGCRPSPKRLMRMRRGRSGMIDWRKGYLPPVRIEPPRPHRE